MPTFFVRSNQIEDKNGNKTVVITGDDAHHISFSLRMREGEKITVCDMQKNFYDCILTSFTANEVTATVVGERKADTEPKNCIKLYQAIPKSDKMEAIIQKSVECGVCEIIPFNSERCIAKIDGKDEEKKLGRYRKIAESAAKQSGRGIVPKIGNPLSYKEAIESAVQSSLCIFCYEGEDNRTLKEVLKNAKTDGTVSVIIGAEGGFSKKEVEIAKEYGAEIVGLGKRILRCETAPVFVLSCITYETEL